MSAPEEEEEEVEPKILFTSEPRPQNKSCSECQHDVRKKYFSIEYVNMSECNFPA